MIKKTIRPADYGFYDCEKIYACFVHPKTGLFQYSVFEVAGDEASCLIDEELVDILFDGEKIRA